MAEQEDISIKIRTILDNSGLAAASKNLQKLREQNQQVATAATKISEATGESMKRVESQLKTAIKQTQRFKFEWLGVMFAGMAMQRVFGGILRASFATWSTVTEGTSRAGGAMTQLQAAWEFFKFSLFDALLNSGLFQTFVDYVIQLVDWWSNLSDKTQSLIGILVVIGLIFGTILFVVGQVALGVNSISLLLFGQNLSVKLLATTITDKLVPAMAAAWAVAGPILLILSIILMIGYIVWLAREIGGVGEFFKAFARGVIRFVAQIGVFWMDTFKTMFDFVFDRTIAFLQGLRKIASVIDFITGSNLAGKLDSSIEGMQALKGTFDNMFDAVGEQFVIKAEDIIAQHIPLAAEGANVSFTDYISGMTKAITDGIKQSNLAEEVGKSVGNNVPKSGNTTVMQSNSFADEMKRQGLGNLL